MKSLPGPGPVGQNELPAAIERKPIRDLRTFFARAPKFCSIEPTGVMSKRRELSVAEGLVLDRGAFAFLGVKTN